MPRWRLQVTENANIKCGISESNGCVFHDVYDVGFQLKLRRAFEVSSWLAGRRRVVGHAGGIVSCWAEWRVRPALLRRCPRLFRRARDVMSLVMPPTCRLPPFADVRDPPPKPGLSPCWILACRPHCHVMSQKVLPTSALPLPAYPPTAPPLPEPFCTPPPPNLTHTFFLPRIFPLLPLF